MLSWWHDQSLGSKTDSSILYNEHGKQLLMPNDCFALTTSLSVSISFQDTSHPSFLGMTLLVPSFCLKSQPVFLACFLSLCFSSASVAFPVVLFLITEQPHWGPDLETLLSPLISTVPASSGNQILYFHQLSKVSPLDFNSSDRDCCRMRGKQTWHSGILPGSAESPICCLGLHPLLPPIFFDSSSSRNINL